MASDKSEERDLVELASNLGELSLKYEVRTPEQFEALTNDLMTNKGAQKRLGELRRVREAPFRAGLEQIKKDFDPINKTLAEAEGRAKRALIAYQDEQAALAREEQRKVDEVARKEQERLAELAAKNAAKAAAAEKAGDEKAVQRYERLAEAAAEREAMVVAPVVTREPPKVSGVSFRTTYSAEVDNLMELVQAVAAGHQPLSYVEANGKVLNAQARTLREQFKCPGVKVLQKQGMAAGTR